VIPEDLRSVSAKSSEHCQEFHLSVHGEYENVAPFRDDCLDLRRQLLLVCYEPKLGIEKGQARCVEDIIGSTDTKSPQWVRPGHRIRLGRRNNNNIVFVHGNHLFLSFVCIGRPSTMLAVVVYGIRPCDDHIPRGFVHSHASHAAAVLVERLRGLPLPSARYHKRHYAVGRGDVERRDAPLAEFDAGNGLFRLEDGPLPGASIVYEVAADDRDGAVGEAHGELGEVVEGRKGGDGELLAAIVDSEGALAARDARLLLQLVQRPHLQHRLVGQVLGDGDEQRRALDLLHVGDGAHVMGLERAHDLEGLRHDADGAIGAAEEDALRARDYRRDVPDLRGVSTRACAWDIILPRTGMSSPPPGPSPAQRRRT
jgi:hypothetical protein